MYIIVPSTAENIIGAIDACDQYPDGADDQFVSNFLDIQLGQAQNALIMAQQLNLCIPHNGKYIKSGPFSALLITSNEKQRAVIFRMVLEQYVPFQTFKSRLNITGLAPKAGEQTKIVHGLTAHRDEIVSTFTNLGQYSGSLIYEGSGLYKVSSSELNISELSASISDLETAKHFVYKKLGPAATDFSKTTDVLDELAMAVQQLGIDKRSPVVHAANAVESFLVQIAQKHIVNINAATGINSKADRLNSAGKLNKKMLNISRYLGHVRNAADHGTDTDINAIWDISHECSVEYVNVALTFIRAVVNTENGIYRI